MKSEVTQLCSTLCDPMDYSLPVSSVHGIFQAKVLEWVVISFSRESSWPRDWTQVSCIAGRFFIIWATREVLPGTELSHRLILKTITGKGNGNVQVLLIIWIPNWQLTPVFLPGEFHGQRSLADYSPWGRKESDMTGWLTLHYYYIIFTIIYMVFSLHSVQLLSLVCFCATL